MRVSIVIPVWNGAAVLADCLDALYAHSGEGLFEVICVDNASQDDSAALIASRYPQAHLIREPVNLGFAGGVNAGIAAAQGDVFVLLNQDALVHPGWLTALLQTLATHPDFGILGCTIFHADGTLDHAGARIERPGAYGVHLTDLGDGRPQPVDYVTGAAMAIRRQTWEAVGHFDEGYYPAYYEESDYCYRARRKGFEIACVPQARVTHLCSSREWQADPIRHTANQHTARYRFVSKHFDEHEVQAFFAAEDADIEAERYLEQAVARVIAARSTLRRLGGILERRRADLGAEVPPHLSRQLQVGFAQVLRHSFAAARRLSQLEPVEEWAEPAEEWQEANRQLQALRQREHDLLARIYFRSPSDARPEPAFKRLFRLLVLRPLSFLVGRDYLLLAELNTVHVARLDQMDYRIQLMNQRIQLMNQRIQLMNQRIQRHIRLLELLTDYDYP